MVQPPLRCGRRRTAQGASLPAPWAGVTHLIQIIGATSTALRSPPNCSTSDMNPPCGRTSLILFKSLVRPPLCYGRRRTALRASLPALRAGVTHLISIIGATSATLRSSPDCPLGVLTRPLGGSNSSYSDRWCDLHCVAVAAGLLYERPYPPTGRELLILFKSLVRPPLRYGRRRTALRASLPARLGGCLTSDF